MKSNLETDIKKQIGVYTLHNPKTDEFYIGSGILGNRKSKPASYLKNNKHENYKLQRAYNKDPIFEFIGIPLENPELSREVNRELALKIEQELINQNFNNPVFLNIAKDVLKPMLGREISEEHKLKLKEAGIERMKDPVYKDKMVKLLQSGITEETYKKIGKSHLGKKHTLVSLEKMNLAQLERYVETPISDESKEKIRLAKIGNKTSEETKARMFNTHIQQYKSGEHLPFWSGKQLSDVTKEKMSEVRKIKANTDEGKEHIKKLQLASIQKRITPLMGDGVKYNSQEEAAKACSLTQPTIFERLANPNFPNW